MQLATVTSGQSRVLAVPGPGWSAALTARIRRIPKLIVRVRFSSPAPRTKAQARAVILVLALIVSRHWMIFRAISPPSLRRRLARPQGGALRAPRAGATARPQPWGRAAARRPSRVSLPLITPPGCARTAVFLGAALSRSRPPRLGRSLWSRRMRSASPDLDTAPTRQGSAPVEEDGSEQDTQVRRAH